jgi:hypothetical protein
MYKELNKQPAKSYEDMRVRLETYLLQWYGGTLNSILPKELDTAATALWQLNQALLADRSVGAICVREPKGNLDTGSHYFVIRYVDDKGQLQLFHPGMELAKVFGMERARAACNYNWVFTSGAIGMSRLLDAVDGVFNILKQCGGVYTQIREI